MEQKDIGALWQRTSAKGEQYLSGKIEVNGAKYYIVLFPNEKNGNDDRPDWRIFPSEPKAQDRVPF